MPSEMMVYGPLVYARHFGVEARIGMNSVLAGEMVVAEIGIDAVKGMISVLRSALEDLT